MEGLIAYATGEAEAVYKALSVDLLEAIPYACTAAVGGLTRLTEGPL